MSATYSPLEHTTWPRNVALVAIGVILFSAAIIAAAKFYGPSIAMGGHTDSTTVRHVVIGRNIVSAPDNAIRFPDARRDGVANRLELYMHWPDMDGFTHEAEADFNNAGRDNRIIFLSIEERSMSRDMSGRFAPIYDLLIEKPGSAGPNGLTVYGFKPNTGYVNETLVVAERPSQDPFVARCLDPSSAVASLAACQRDIEIGDQLSVTYRFPSSLLPEWAMVEAAVRAKLQGMVRG